MTDALESSYKGVSGSPSGAWGARDSMTSSVRMDSSGCFSPSAVSAPFSSSSSDDSDSLRRTVALLGGPGRVDGGCAAGVPFGCMRRFFFSRFFFVLFWLAVKLNPSMFSRLCSLSSYLFAKNES